MAGIRMENKIYEVGMYCRLSKDDAAGMKAGDIDPRCRAEHCFTVSDKARAIGGGVLEGLLYFERRAGLWSV